MSNQVLPDNRCELTYEQQLVAELVARDISNQEIAHRLGIPEVAVTEHIVQICLRLKVRSPIGIANWIRDRQIWQMEQKLRAALEDLSEVHHVLLREEAYETKMRQQIGSKQWPGLQNDQNGSPESDRTRSGICRG